MGLEIERKFLLKGDEWRSLADGKPYRQGYIRTNGENTVRVRVAGDKGFLTIKGPVAGATRTEYEYEIPLQDALEMLERLCDKPYIEKIRHTVPVEGFVWEIDEFQGANAGLVVAEVELDGEDQAFDKPDWVGDEVTGDPRYYNGNLTVAPYATWKST